jgi:CO/xanthine dehydrogenase Mo-binding subunit
MGHIRAAITNAIFNATGIRVRRLPVTPGDIKSGVLSNSSGKK